MNEEPDKATRARRDMLTLAAGILGTASQMRDLGAGDGNALLVGARVEIASVAMSPVNADPVVVAASEPERVWVLQTIDDALAAKGALTGLDPLTWAERQVQERFKPLVFR